MTERQESRRKQLLDETRGYWKLEEEALDRTVCGKLATNLS